MNQYVPWWSVPVPSVRRGPSLMNQGTTMNRILYTLFLALVNLNSANAKEISLSVNSSPEQEIRYSGGNAHVIDRISDTAAGVAYLKDIVLGKPTFYFIAENGKSRVASFNFGPENITATYRGKPIAIFKIDDLNKILRGRASTANALSGLGDMGYRMNGDTLGRVRNEIDRRERNSNFVKRAELMNDQYLKTETIFPGKLYKGFVIIEKLDSPKKGDELIFDVETGGEHHIFRFSVAN